MSNDEQKYLGRAYLLGIPLWKVELSKEKWEKALVIYRSSKSKIFYYKPIKEGSE